MLKPRGRKREGHTGSLTSICKLCMLPLTDLCNWPSLGESILWLDNAESCLGVWSMVGRWRDPFDLMWDSSMWWNSSWDICLNITEEKKFKILFTWTILILLCHSPTACPSVESRIYLGIVGITDPDQTLFPSEITCNWFVGLQCGLGNVDRLSRGAHHCKSSCVRHQCAVFRIRRELCRSGLLWAWQVWVRRSRHNPSHLRYWYL